MPAKEKRSGNDACFADVVSAKALSFQTNLVALHELRELPTRKAARGQFGVANGIAA